MKQIILITFFCLSVLTLFAQKNRVDYRYAPDWHVTTPAFPDDTCKTLVGPVGQLLYDYGGKVFYPYALEKGFRMVIHFLPDEGVKITAQKLYSSRVPIVETTGTFLDMSVKQEVFSLATDYMKEQISTRKGNREDIVLMTIDNITPHDQIINPVLIINSEHPVVIEKNEIVIGKKERFLISEPIVRVRKNLADFKTLIEYLLNKLNR